MKSKFLRVSMFGAVLLAPVVTAVSASAVPYDPATDLTTNGATVATGIGAEITSAMPYAAGLLVAVIGWRYFRKFVH